MEERRRTDGGAGETGGNDRRLSKSPLSTVARERG
jgi:hypothetical protein